MALTSTASSARPLAALADRGLAWRLAVVLAGSWAIALSAWIEVPMVPVPMTMQTYAILLVGALSGRRLAIETVGAYLLQGAIGLPVFAGGAAGLLHMAGPTGGYLIGFLLAAALIGHLADRGWNRRLVTLTASLTLGHVVIFALGVAWLASLIGLEKAIAAGVTPFIIGSVVKTALAVATVRVAESRR